MNLDNPTTYSTYDTQDQMGSIHLLGKQFEHALEIGNLLDVPSAYSTCSQIVFSGMGGSALGAYVIKHLYGNMLETPYDIVNDYNLPSYVGDQTLVIIQSYSGTTEESLSGFRQAHEKGARIITISGGGELEQVSLEHGYSHFHIDPKHNPCNQPRMAIGYSIGAQISILRRLGYIALTDDELHDIQHTLETNRGLYAPEVSLENNPAKQLAQSLLGQFPIYCAGEFLQGAIHAMRNQFHENAKSFAVEHPVPEMNHHLLEALRFPKGIHSMNRYIFIDSRLYSDRIQQRMEYSAHIIADAGHPVTHVQATGDHPLTQVLSTIQFGAYAGLYLAMLEEIDPSPIPNVEALKKKLAK